MEVKPLNLEEIKKLIEDCAKDYETFGDARIDATFMKIKQCIKSACSFYLRYVNKINLFAIENPRYFEELKKFLNLKQATSILWIDEHEFYYVCSECFSRNRDCLWSGNTRFDDRKEWFRTQSAAYRNLSRGIFCEFCITESILNEYNDWLFKLAFKGVLDDDM